MSKQKELQKISIVFEETGQEGIDQSGKPGKRFNVYLSGQTRNLNHVKDKDLSSAEFWALKCFAIVVDAIQRAGAVDKIQTRPDGGVTQ